MKFRVKLICLAATLLTVSAALSGTAEAQTAPTPPGYADFLPATSSAAVATAGAAQCGVSVARRAGAWVCIDQAASQRLKASLGGAEARPAVTNYCTVAGCWDLVDSTHAEFYGSFVFGYGGTELGTGGNYVKWTLTGANERENPVRSK